MKKLLLLALVGLAWLPLHAQKTIEKKIPYTTGQRVNLDLKFANTIRVKAWDQPEVSVKVNVTINGGKLNDALLVTTATRADEISFNVDFDQDLIKQGRKEDCPGNTSGHVNWNGDRNGNYVCSELVYEVYVPRQADVHLETINGDVTLTECTGPLFVKSISGFVDVSWPKNKGADVVLQSITGELYSNLDISYQNKSDKPTPVGYQLKGKLNGGGTRLQLESISNDVYLRGQ